MGFVDNLFHLRFQILKQAIGYLTARKKLWITCKLSRNPPTELPFHYFTMLQICTCLYSRK